jgi:hypothetical protein
LDDLVVEGYNDCSVNIVVLIAMDSLDKMTRDKV